MIKLSFSENNPDFAAVSRRIAELRPAAEAIYNRIADDSMAGWFRLVGNHDSSELSAIKSAAENIRKTVKYLVCIGVGGSYLGHRAIIEALGSTSPVKILYAGNSLSAKSLSRVLAEIGDADFAVNVISKSGTTTEPAIAFRLLKAKLQEKYGENYYRYIYATTDKSRGALHAEAVANHYARFIVPDDIGGRYSVLTAVSLLPLAVAGIDIDELIAAAVRQKSAGRVVAIEYAVIRTALYQLGKTTEVLASMEPDMFLMHEWWKQLFGESEGKHGKGIFPSSVVYTTDLHSLGQYLQDGRRELFETVIEFESVDPSLDISVPSDPDNLDNLNYLASKPLSAINRVAAAATISAHRDGGLNILELFAPSLSVVGLGELIIFFQTACAISAQLLGLNPYDQPGVENYKTEMFARLGKPTQ